MPTIGEMATVSIESRTRELADNVSDNNALLSVMKKKGKVKPVSGGEFIQEELSYGGNNTFVWMDGYQNVNVRPQAVLTSAKYDFKNAVISVAIAETEIAKNSGPERIIDLWEGRVDNAVMEAMNQVDEGLYSNGMGSGGLQIDGLQGLVADSPNTGTVGGINAATYSWWRNQSPTAVTLTVDNIEENMISLWLSIQRMKEPTDLIVADDTLYGLLWRALEGNRRYVRAEPVTKAGHRGIEWNGAMVIPGGGIGSHAPNNHMYFLNCKYLSFRPHRNYNFKSLPDRHVHNQVATIRLIMWIGNLTCRNRMLQGVLRGS